MTDATKTVEVSRYFQLISGKHAKFYRIELWTFTNSAPIVYIHHGRIGTKGQEHEKAFDLMFHAKTYMNKKITEKQGKGYVEITMKDGVASAPVNTKASQVAAASAQYQVNEEVDIATASKQMEVTKKRRIDFED